MGVQFAGNILVQSNGEPLPISMGGTGQSTAPTAINALVPVQSGNTGKVLTTNGSVVSWQTGGGGGTPGGADTQIQFNDAGTFGGNANFTINKTTGVVSYSAGTVSTVSNISSTSGTNRSVIYQTSGSDRWILKADTTAETGSNVGSNFALVAVADNGLTQNTALSISRATQIVDFKVAPTLNGVVIGSAPAAAGALTGTTLAANVVSSSLTSVGTLASLAVTGAITTGGIEVGTKIVPQNIQSAAYTLVLADSSKFIFHPSADTTARTYTIPSNASVPYPIGTALMFVNQNAAGVITIAINADSLRLAGAGTPGARTLAANGIATAIKITATEWIISGTGLS